MTAKQLLPAARDLRGHRSREPGSDPRAVRSSILSPAAAPTISSTFPGVSLLFLPWPLSCLLRYNVQAPHSRRIVSSQHSKGQVSTVLMVYYVTDCLWLNQ